MWYINKLERKGESYVVGAHFFKGFIKNVLTPEYVIFVLNKGEPKNKFLLNAYADYLTTYVKDYNQLRIAMDKVNNEITRVSPPKYQGRFFLDKLNEYANINRVYFAGKKTRKVRKQKRRKTRGKRLRK